MTKLTARKVNSLKARGFYGDGEGLYLKAGEGGAKSWILRTVVHGRRRDLGLGSARLVSLAEARTKAREFRRIAREGGDPDTIRKQKSLSFEEAARRVHAQLLPTWKNKKHAETWLATVENYANPKIGKRPLHTIGTADVLSVLAPIWTERHETARRLKQRLSTIFDWAKGAGHYPHENPVNGIKKALPTVKRQVQHMSDSVIQRVIEIEGPEFIDEAQRKYGTGWRIFVGEVAAAHFAPALSRLWYAANMMALYYVHHDDMRLGFGADTTEDYRAIDVRRLKREGLLSPGQAYGWQWSRNGAIVASIRIRTEPGRIILTYRHRHHGGDWQDESYPIYLDTTPCHLGGERHWFRCPAGGCNRRVAILYGGAIFACRHCHRLVYASQRQKPWDRASRRADRIRDRLNWPGGILEGNGWGRPKGMHLRTYERLCREHDAHSDRAMTGIMGYLECLK